MLLLQSIETPTAEQISEHADSARAVVEQFAQQMVTDPTGAIEELVQKGIEFGLKLLAALLIYTIGAWIIRRIRGGLSKMFLRKQTDKVMASFVSSLVSISLTILLITITIGTLGVNTTTLAALLAAGGVAIGMSLSGTVQNFAGGLMILAFKPFKAGDYIEAQGYAGTVTDVSIVSTRLTTPDNRSVIIPNGTLANGNIDNYHHNPLRRIEWKITVSYGTDADACIALLKDILKADARVLDTATPTAADPFAALAELQDSALCFVARAWTTNENYWDVYYDINRKIYQTLPAQGITFPYPQLDVHIN